MGPLFASVLALLLLALSCEGQAAQAGAPVEERPLPPLMSPPGALSEPRPGEGAAPDPLVSELDADADADADPARRAQPGSASFRQPTFADAAAGRVTETPRGDVPADAAGVLFGQLQDLQQEIMDLRGIIEAQQNRIARLEREQRDRYLDLDRRLSLMGSGTGSDAQGGGLAGGDPSAGGFGGAGSDADGDVDAPQDERAAYERAFALTREKRFEEAIPAFRRVIDDYPGGQYVPNAWYWLGELYLALPEPDLELARQSFVQVIQLWPENRKVPDAKYKLGVVYDRLGETEQARSHLQAVVAEHEGSPAARLASSYLERIEG